MPVEWSENVCIGHLADDPLFSDELDEVVHRLEEEPQHCVLEFSGVTFINSSNLAQLVGVRRLLNGTGCRLLLCSIKPELWEPFKVSGLDRLFTRVESLPVALASLQMEQRQA